MIFYQIPKTGGSWVVKAMRNAGMVPRHCRGSDRHEYGLRRDHATPDVVWPRYREGRLGFCFIRHPITWYRSFWCYRLKTQDFNPGFPIDRCWSQNPEEYLDCVFETFPGGFVTKLYSYYVDDVDFVGRQENLEDDLVKALHLGGESFDEVALRATPPYVVVGSDPKYSSQYHVSQESQERILDIESLTIRRFYGD